MANASKRPPPRWSSRGICSRNKTARAFALGDALGGEARVARIVARIRDIPAGFVRTYGDIDPDAPRMVGRVLATTHEDLPWHRVVRADGSIPKGARQRALLLREGVPMRGERIDLERARLTFWDE